MAHFRMTIIVHSVVLSGSASVLQNQSGLVSTQNTRLTSYCAATAFCVVFQGKFTPYTLLTQIAVNCQILPKKRRNQKSNYQSH